MQRIARRGLLLYHPSSEADAIRSVEALSQKLETEQRGYAMLSLAEPPGEAAAHASAAPPGAEFVVAPLLVAPGRHFHVQVKAMVEAIESARPDLKIRLRPPLLDDPSFIDAWLDSL